MVKLCDRCGEVIVNSHSRVTIRNFYEYELCEQCAAALKKWIEVYPLISNGK